MTVSKEQAMQMFDRDLEILMNDLRGMQAHYNIPEWEAFVFLRKPDSPDSYVVKYAAADDGFAKRIVALHTAPAPPTQTKGEREPLVRRIVGSSRHPHFTHADHERMKATLDALSDNPTEEEAEAVLQACGTSGKKVVNDFIERLLRERSEMQSEIERSRAASSATAAPKWFSDAISAVEEMEANNKRNYEYWKSIASDPTDMGVMKFLCWAGEDSRIIAMLKSLSLNVAEPVTTTTTAARACAEDLNRSNYLLSDATPEELAEVATIITRHCLPTAVPESAVKWLGYAKTELECHAEWWKQMYQPHFQARAEQALAMAGDIGKVIADFPAAGVEAGGDESRAVCDCHSWPTVSEMHDYVESLEHIVRGTKPEHECKPIARAVMDIDRDWWVGELLEPIPEWPKETHCLHMKTPVKDVWFLCNSGDFEQLMVIGNSVVRLENLEWLKSMTKGAEVRAALHSSDVAKELGEGK